MKKIFAILLAVCLSFGAVDSAYNSNAQSKSHSQEIDDLKLKLEKEIKFLFEDATKFENGELKVNKQLMIEKYGLEKAPYIALGIERIYKEKDLAKNLKAELQNRDFISCMEKELIGMIPGMELIDIMSGDLRTYIEGKMWGKAAEYIAKKLIKFGIKSNVAGIVAQLGISAGKCIIWG
ncbi:MAG: hypothetical protein PT934_06480 [Peptoniphilaceae bacterium]|uniref:hypothetical protein n=1 Tax=Parvimonas sp. TaxID=1944660 RepID=UPI0025FB5986|nr:hypothetical protein [Parvimonas sp.]MCI5997343.1 hypothetical protein [Parvimonas sp.]MDD7765398.1 hypothetical protein [Peptoniphilaceae bacterium]MDY3050664.1 hypothetical protein [Parvimonas sp.]